MSLHHKYVYNGLQSFPYAQTTIFKMVSVLIFPCLEQESSFSPQIYGWHVCISHFFMHVIWLTTLNLMALSAQLKSWNFSLCIFLHPSITSSLLGFSILLSTGSQTASQCYKVQTCRNGTSSLFRIFCVPTCYLKTKRLKYTELWPTLLLYTGVTLSKDHGLQVAEKRMLRKIFGPNKETVIQKHNKMDY
jgi:hypothetical protein